MISFQVIILVLYLAGSFKTMPETGIYTPTETVKVHKAIVFSSSTLTAAQELCTKVVTLYEKKFSVRCTYYEIVTPLELEAREGSPSIHKIGP